MKKIKTSIIDEIYKKNYNPNPKRICDFCGKDTLNKEGLGINYKKKHHCIECFELITGKKARCICIN